MPDQKPSKFRASAPVMFILKDVQHWSMTHSQYRFNRFWALMWGIGIIVIPFFRHSMPIPFGIDHPGNIVMGELRYPLRGDERCPSR